MPHFLLKALWEVDKHWYTKKICFILSAWSKVSFDILEAILSCLVQEQSLRVWAHKNQRINFFLLCSKIDFPIYYQKGILDFIFVTQTVNLSQKDQKRPKKLKKYGLVKPCSLLKIVWISCGATVFSRISFYWSDNIHEQDTDKS